MDTGDKKISRRVTYPRPVIIKLEGRRFYLDPATIKLMGGVEKVLALNSNALKSRYYSVQEGVRYNQS